MKEKNYVDYAEALDVLGKLANAACEIDEDNIDFPQPIEVNKALAVLKELAYKTIPFTPISKANRHGAFCPKCGEEIEIKENQKKWKCCPYCTQPLIWED